MVFSFLLFASVNFSDPHSRYRRNIPSLQRFFELLKHRGHAKTMLTILPLFLPPTYLQLTLLLNKLIK